MEREREKQRGKKRLEKSNAVSNNQGCIYSITQGIVYCIQCIINKMCKHNEVWGCAEIFPSLLRNLNGKINWDFSDERNNVERY